MCKQGCKQFVRLFASTIRINTVLKKNIGLNYKASLLFFFCVWVEEKGLSNLYWLKTTLYLRIPFSIQGCGALLGQSRDHALLLCVLIEQQFVEHPTNIANTKVSLFGFGTLTRLNYWTDFGTELDGALIKVIGCKGGERRTKSLKNGKNIVHVSNRTFIIILPAISPKYIRKLSIRTYNRDKKF